MPIGVRGRYTGLGRGVVLVVNVYRFLLNNAIGSLFHHSISGECLREHNCIP